MKMKQKTTKTTTKNKVKKKFSLPFFKKKPQLSGWEKNCLTETGGKTELPEYWNQLTSQEKERWINEFMDGHDAKRYFKTVY